jgi:ABC-2 type transport system ATP-binding protein
MSFMPFRDSVLTAEDHTAGDWAVEAHGLTKSFGTTRAAAGVDLAIPRGSIYAVLGPNGSGKTTTLRILATLLRPDSGTARVFGHDVVRDAAAVRAKVSLTGQLASVDTDLSCSENLALLAQLLGHSRRRARERANELLDAFGLAQAAGRQVSTLSGGMRRRLDIAASIIVTPQLLFLDEPTTGLDPRSRAHLWGIVRSVVADGTTVLLTTQYLDEADQLADRIAVMNCGQVIAAGTGGELKNSVGTLGLRVRLLDPTRREEAQRVLAVALGTGALGIPDGDQPDEADSTEPSSVRARIVAGADGRDTAQIAAAALSRLSQAGIAVTDFALGQPSLDEVFFALTAGASEPDAAQEATR